MAALAALEDFANGAIRRELVFRDREDLLARDGGWLISCFRFPRAILLELWGELRLALECKAEANRLGPCLSTLSRARPAEWGNCPHLSRYNKFQQANNKAQFSAGAGFPNVIGAIDCTHIAIKAPSHDEFVYVRKHFH